jgi:asparagine synthase (glutamine-hydrolysing)
MAGKLPKSIINRKKKGFGIPLAKWLREDLRELCETTLSKKEIDSSGLFNYSFIEKLKTDHFTKKQNNGRKLWSLIVFHLWLQK